MAENKANCCVATFILNHPMPMTHKFLQMQYMQSHHSSVYLCSEILIKNHIFPYTTPVFRALIRNLSDYHTGGPCWNH